MREAGDGYEIRTPENVVFVFALAGVGARALAWLVDVAVMGLLWGVAAAIAGTLGLWFGGFAMALYFVLAFFVQWGYATIAEWRWAGQTVGKRVVGLRVLSRQGTRIGFMQSVVRNLLRIVDLLPVLYLAGGASALLDRHGRRLGDIAAGTVVVRERRAPRPVPAPATAAATPAFAREAASAHVVDRITAAERDAMLALCARRDTLPLPVRYALFARIARHLEARLRMSRPAHLSDENFVLHLTAVASVPGRALPAGEAFA